MLKRQKDCEQLSQKQTDNITTNFTQQNSKVSNDAKHPGKQLAPTIIVDPMGFENYVKTMRSKADSEMEIQSDNMNDSVKTCCRRGRQKICTCTGH